MDYRQYTNILRQLGFTFARNGKGSHEIWSNKERIVVVTRGGVNRMIARKTLKNIGYVQWEKI